MNMDHLTPVRWIMAFFAVLFLLFTNASIVLARDLPPVVRQAVFQKFPGAHIKETRRETLEGRKVVEVELTAENGTDYEMILYENGEIFSIEEDRGVPLIGGELSIGVGVMVEKDIYKGVDTEVMPAPFLSYELGRLEIQSEDGLGASFDIIKTELFSFSVKGALMLDPGYDPDDSDDLKGMDKLDTLYSAGADMKMHYGDWEVGLEVLQDISGEHDGQEVEFSIGYRYDVAGFTLGPKLSFTWLSEDAVDYFYGVSAAEARVGRPAYSPGSSFEVGAEIMIQRQVYGNLSLVGIAGVSTFGSEITDSPIVDEDYTAQGVLGVIYEF